MNAEWVNKKNAEMEKKEVYQKEHIRQELLSAKYFSDDEKEILLKQLDLLEENPYDVSLIANIEFGWILFKGNKEDQYIQEYNLWKSNLHIDTYKDILLCKNQYSRYLDSEKKEFDGDIIITDPCYIIKDRHQIGKYPYRSDFYSYDRIEDYPDREEVNIRTLSKDDQLMIEFGIKSKYISKKREEEEMAYEKAMREYKEKNPDDWENCEYGSHMEKLGIRNYLSRDTLYGDWGCTTYDMNTKEAIGSFCADAGMVAVFSLEEVLKYNPDFDYHISKPWTTTWIKNFKGTVQFIVNQEISIYEGKENYDVIVEGHGINKITGNPIHFLGKQTGL